MLLYSIGMDGANSKWAGEPVTHGWLVAGHAEW
jgi:hypothetical protein